MDKLSTNTMFLAWSWGNDILRNLVKQAEKRALSVEDLMKWLANDADAIGLMLDHLADVFLVKQEGFFKPWAPEGYAFFRVRNDHLALSLNQVRRSLDHYGYVLSDGLCYTIGTCSDTPESPFLVISGVNDYQDFKIWDQVQRYKGHTHKCTRRYWILAREKKPA